jgi:hypothetical protein
MANIKAPFRGSYAVQDARNGTKAATVVGIK